MCINTTIDSSLLRVRWQPLLLTLCYRLCDLCDFYSYSIQPRFFTYFNCSLSWNTVGINSFESLAYLPCWNTTGIRWTFGQTESLPALLESLFCDDYWFLNCWHLLAGLWSILKNRPHYIHRGSRRGFNVESGNKTNPGVIIGNIARLAIMHRAELKLSPLPMPDLSSMECLAFKCKPPYSMTVLLIYRPPKPNPSFLPEISDLLTSLCTMLTNIVIVGDLNIHVDNPSCQIAGDFLSMLECLGLQQHVEVPTHTKGHTLDLVITDSASISNLQVYDLGVSDHKVVSMALTFVLPTIRPKRQMSFRNWKSIDSATMTTDLQLITCPASASMDELVELYNTSLTSVFDLHAPVKSREVIFSCSAPWFTHELRKIKSAGRVLERRCRHSGLTVHKQAFREHQRAYSNSLKDARSQYYSSLINETLATLNSFFQPQTIS
ncbi:uncharacterized protein LOC116396593 [Anarrhichthys ocellatus]|uniref:uncharacterized protein LOC116396593 n=1 Tax=Anarrhichthys ocellatus TaxID=433405 RepID=UPI0012ED8962|nr:uncharacterized protein LOC116396593 [Anarrhichthys ocellatus]